jgi:hypothetical protein
MKGVFNLSSGIIWACGLVLILVGIINGNTPLTLGGVYIGLTARLNDISEDIAKVYMDGRE